MVRTAALIIGAALALMAGAAAFSAAGQRADPALAARAFPLAGDARAEWAMSRYEAQMRKAEDPVAAPDPAIRALAGEAYRREPLNLDAAFILQRGGPQLTARQRLAALDAAHRLSRRSTPISFDLLTEHSRAGNTAEAIMVLDNMLRRQTGVHGQLLEFLSRLAADRSTHGDFVTLLSREPNWAGQFWRQLAQNPQGLTGAWPLWQRIHSAGIATEPELDALLVSGLADQGLYSDGEALARRLSALDWGAGLRNGEFGRLPDVVPFDWQVYATGEYGADIAADREALIVSAVSGSRGMAARQVVGLGQARYRVNADFEAAGETPGEDMLRLQVECLAPAGQGMLLDVALARLPASFTGAGCRWAQVALMVAVPEAADGQEWMIERVSLRPALVEE